jgi:hypothetical protein
MMIIAMKFVKAYALGNKKRKKIQFNPSQIQGPQFSSINSHQYYCLNHAILFHESRFQNLSHPT